MIEVRGDKVDDGFFAVSMGHGAMRCHFGDGGKEFRVHGYCPLIFNLSILRSPRRQRSCARELQCRNLNGEISLSFVIPPSGTASRRMDDVHPRCGALTTQLIEKRRSCSREELGAFVAPASSRREEPSGSKKALPGPDLRENLSKSKRSATISIITRSRRSRRSN